MTRICALPGCEMEFDDSKGFKLGMNPGKYCSNDCVNEAFMLKKEGKPFAKPEKETKKAEETNVKLPAEDFGESGVVRRFCDNATCHRPVTLEWRSRISGKIYCSNECLKTEKPEKETRRMTTEDNDSPIAPASKKASKKAAKADTKKGAKKATAKAASNGNGVGRSKYPDDAAITVKKTDLDGIARGKRAEALEVLLKSKNYGAFKAGLAKKEAAGNDRLSTYAGWAVKTAIDNGLVTIKG